MFFMIIKNRDALITSSLRRKAIEILEAGIESVLPANIMNSIKFDKLKRHLIIKGDCYSTSQGRIFVVGGGKASGLMALELEAILGWKNITDGIVICKSSQFQGKRISIIEAGHPIPDQRGVAGVGKIFGFKERYSIKKMIRY
jgi:glycerate 2-kinase